MFHRPPRRVRTVPSLLLLVLAIVLGGCAGPGGTASPMTPAGTSPSADPASPPPTFSVDEVLNAREQLDGTRITVRGFFLTDGTAHVICEAVLESYPPQCGGARVAVVGAIPPPVLAMLESSAGQPDLAQRAWGDVEVRGVFRGGGAEPTLELAEMRVVR